MHPLNKNLFGENGIAVLFNNGTATVNGYILRQLGTSRFNVTDGTVTVTATLATTLAAAEDLPLNTMTILIGPNNEHVAHLYSKQTDTLEGHTYAWSLGTSADGSVVIETYATASS